MSALIVAFRWLLYLFHDVERGGGAWGVGKHKLCTYGAGGMAESWWAGTLSYAKITHSLGSIFVLDRTRKKPKHAAFITPTA